PQIDASRIACAMSLRSITSARRSPSPGCSMRSRISSCRAVPTRHGTHWPHDSSRKNRAIRSRTCFMSAVSSKTMTAPDPSVAPLEHDVQDVDQRLDVVGQRRLAEQTDLHRERRLVPRLAALAFDGVEQRRLLAAYIGARATPNLDLEIKQAMLARLGDRVL